MNSWTAYLVFAPVAALLTIGVALSAPSTASESSQQAAIVESTPSTSDASASDVTVVKCTNLVYAGDKIAKCFAPHFLADAAQTTHLHVDPRFAVTRLESEALFEHPFAILSGDEAFTLTEGERNNLQRYLLSGGFVLASSSCGSQAWGDSFQREITSLFPGMTLIPLPADHPVFHTVRDTTSVALTSGRWRLPTLKALVIDGRIAMIWSPEGLNDTAAIGGDCCCCGGEEIKSARLVNLNILAYALTH